MRKFTIGLIGFISLAALFSFRLDGNTETHWLSIKEAEELYKKEPRPVLIDLYTDWCGWCKVMDKKTYRQTKVAAYLNEKFYCIKLNAEDKGAVVFNGKTFQYNGSYKVNEIALALTNGQLSYPTTIIIPKIGEEPQVIPGFIEPKDFEPIVKFFGEKGNEKIPFVEFHRNFKGNW